MKQATAAILALMVVSMLALTGANTQKRLGPNFINYGQTIAHAQVKHMNATAVGLTFTYADRKESRWWSFQNSVASTCSLQVWSTAIPGFTGDKEDSTANFITIQLDAGQNWIVEGVPIYAFRMIQGSVISVTARD